MLKKFLIVFAVMLNLQLSVHSTENPLLVNGSDITRVMRQNKAEILPMLWDSEELQDTTFRLSEIDDMTTTDYVMIYILIDRGNLLVNNTFYQQKLLSLINKNLLSKNDWLKLFLAFSEQESHEMFQILKFKVGHKKLENEVDQIINATDHPTINEIKEIIQYKPELTSYSVGEYVDTTRSFVFCRSDRNSPCLLVMQDKRGDWVRDTNGDIFSRPVLAKSSRDLPAHKTNGNTPRGIHTMDSVMPLADQFALFGAYRRVKLDFIPGTNNEQWTKHMLPQSQHDRYWWRYNSLARDNGRSLFRIHGTGRPNFDVTTPYYPHRPSAGCITSLEGDYPENTYTDQRPILDAMMRSLDLVETYENEDLIKGFLVLIEINALSGAVKMDELKELGIFDEYVHPAIDNHTPTQSVDIDDIPVEKEKVKENRK